MPPRTDEGPTGRTPEPVRTIGRYALYGELASGGMATVHFGRLLGEAGFTRPVAIKRLHAQFAKDPVFRRGLIDEARIVSRIRHQNVVPTLDVFECQDELFLVMEYVPGESLWRLMKEAYDRRVQVPPTVAFAIVSNVLHGLHAAHEARAENGKPLLIVHRDVSPQNVLVGTDGAARLLDFGVARAALGTEVTEGDKIKGKLSYMAPEQLACGTVTRRADIYAATVVLWELLAGRRLFRTGDPQALALDKLARGKVPRVSMLNENVPRAFDVIVRRGIARSAMERYATAREMALAIERASELATPSEVGAWVDRLAKTSLARRASTVASCESLSLPAAKQFPTPTATSLGGLAVATPMQLALPTLPAPPAKDTGSGDDPLSSQARHGGRRSLASLLEPDLDANVTARLRLLSLDRKRIALASLVAGASFVASVAILRALTLAGSDDTRAPKAVAPRGARVLAEPLRSCPDGMALIPGGWVALADSRGTVSDRPARIVTVAPYCIDVVDVAVTDYAACVDRGDCPRGASFDWAAASDADRSTMAGEYCTAHGARLPTDAEWRLVAHGGDGRRRVGVPSGMVGLRCAADEGRYARDVRR
jgi:serine/threonine-protein kinase